MIHFASGLISDRDISDFNTCVDVYYSRFVDLFIYCKRGRRWKGFNITICIILLFHSLWIFNINFHWQVFPIAPDFQDFFSSGFDSLPDPHFPPLFDSSPDPHFPPLFDSSPDPIFLLSFPWFYRLLQLLHLQ